MVPCVVGTRRWTSPLRALPGLTHRADSAERATRALVIATLVSRGGSQRWSTLLCASALRCNVSEIPPRRCRPLAVV